MTSQAPSTSERSLKRSRSEMESVRPEESKRGKRARKKAVHWRGRELSSTDDKTAISSEMTRQFRASFEKSERYRATQNSMTSLHLKDLALNRPAVVATSHLFSHKVDPHPKASDQKHSGRCWLFAALNSMRVAMIKKYSLPNSFEFSQSHLAFWDKFEKANSFLNWVIKYREEPLDSQYNDDLFSSPLYDGGGWGMARNLIEKYGVMPKSAMPESKQSSDTDTLNLLLKRKLREDALILRRMGENGAEVSALQEKKTELLSVIYRMISMSYGIPPESFDWQYETKNKEMKTLRGLTPKEFYKEHVPYDLSQKVTLFNYPSKNILYNHRYTLENSDTVTGGSRESYLNLTIKKIQRAVIRSLKAGDIVYFSCDVRKFYNKRLALLDPVIYDYGLLFDTTFSMSKAERLATQDSRSSHAMALCGVNLEKKKPNRWLVENSWGTSSSKDGYLSMTHDWFRNYTFKFVVDKKYLPESIQRLAEQAPELVPPWGL